MTLGDASLVAFLATVDAVRARDFYERTLGLKLVEDSAFALVFDAGGTMLRIQKVARLAPHPFTALGWRVPDIVGAVRDLRRKGIAFERFPSLEQDGNGVWLSPVGARVAWFRDPDGNVLSLTEFPA